MRGGEVEWWITSPSRIACPYTMQSMLQDGGEANEQSHVNWMPRNLPPRKADLNICSQLLCLCEKENHKCSYRQLYISPSINWIFKRRAIMPGPITHVINTMCLPLNAHLIQGTFRLFEQIDHGNIFVSIDLWPQYLEQMLL